MADGRALKVTNRKEGRIAKKRQGTGRRARKGRKREKETTGQRKKKRTAVADLSDLVHVLYGQNRTRRIASMQNPAPDLQNVGPAGVQFDTNVGLGFVPNCLFCHFPPFSDALL